ncbi:MAG: pyridoxine 5'-phosphate synthase [Acidobacteriota bacterium]|jgi:pyridoxine 5-phosphate synthase
MKLGVKLDHVATLRQARRGSSPDPVHAAVLAELGGADYITVHIRADRRHIQERDLDLLKQTLSLRLDLEMAATAEMVEQAASVAPWQVTLVPERPNEVTTESGLDVVLNEGHIRQVVSRLQSHDARVCILVDPSLEQVRAAHKVGAQAVELNTAQWAAAEKDRDRGTEFDKLREAARLASKLGLDIFAGHGLDRESVAKLVEIREIRGVTVGHSLVARALFVGMREAVSELKAILRKG